MGAAYPHVRQQIDQLQLPNARRLWGKACAVKLDLSNGKDRKTSKSAYTERSLTTIRSGRKVLGVSSGRRKEDKETWWWNEEVQDSVQRKRLAKKKWDMDRTEENRQEYKELQRRVKREVSKAKQKAYDELYTRLDTREGEKDLYRLARQRDRDGKDVQQVRVIKDRDGRVLTSEESVQRRWKEYFEELMNEENEREKRVEGVNSVEQKVDKIRKDEVRKALKRMKSGKAVGPDDIPVEVWKCLGEAAVEFLASLFNRVLESERMPEEWRRSVLVPIFKNKGDVQSCSNYRGIKLMSHTMKLWERVVEARLRKVVEICEQQYGFMPRKSTTDAIFALRILMEKYRDGQRELHCVFVDLEKAYDRVPREELWYCMRKLGVAGKYVRVVQDMYERSRTVVRCAVGQTEEFNVEVGLHQGSALSPFLFAIVMDQLSEEVRQESPWTMMFADDIVICSESREQVEENLERWRFALERRGMKVSRSKTEYMCVNEREGSGTVRLQGEEVKKVEEFKYLGSTVQSNGECGKEVKKRVQACWNGWRKVSGVLCDQKISARIKGKVYRTVVRPAMLYGLETVSLRKRQESELEVAELKMLRFSLGVTRLDRIRNEYIRGTAHVGHMGDKVRETRLRWFGHVQRRESEYIGRRMLDMELPGRRQRGRPKRRYMDGINEDMKLSSGGPTQVELSDWESVTVQRLQLLSSVCRNSSLWNLTHTPLRKFVLDRIFVCDKHKILFCQTPKVGNTQWKKVLIVLNGKFSKVEDIPANVVHDHERNGLPRLSSMSDTEITERLNTYFKFFIVRDPFERLISAFKDKFVENPRFEPWYKHSIAPTIIRKYRKSHRDASGSAGLHFEDFVRYLGDEPGRKHLDRQFGEHVIHWLTYVELCAPCDISYDVIGHHETLEQDAQYILKAAGIEDLVSYPSIPKGITVYNRTKVERYFSGISKRDIRRLYASYQGDFSLFGYHRPDFLLD
ncbi:hypothetical protein QTP70_022787 [Hemibagrus guttatus]|uniref:Carbohydrate sulfotransferase n=1 Tax=Hemibagrus guttatus TaxID=175788 RepID=A0AAE0PZH9_9TELE|nr:hypothetical protein QTP70_022787 [Hemibagrus guttatus]